MCKQRLELREISKMDSKILVDDGQQDKNVVNEREFEIGKGLNYEQISEENFEQLSEEEMKQMEAHKLASMCYCEKLNSKEEEEEIEDKPDKVKFADMVVVCPTYTSQEYDREPDDDWREKERAVEEMVEKLDIIIVETDPSNLGEFNFVDYHRMLENVDDPENIPICDFGVYVASMNNYDDNKDIDVRIGDLVLFLDDEDFLNSTAAQFKNHLAKQSRSRVSLTLGRNLKKEVV